MACCLLNSIHFFLPFSKHIKRYHLLLVLKCLIFVRIFIDFAFFFFVNSTAQINKHQFIRNFRSRSAFSDIFFFLLSVNSSFLLFFSSSHSCVYFIIVYFYTRSLCLLHSFRSTGCTLSYSACFCSIFFILLLPVCVRVLIFLLFFFLSRSFSFTLEEGKKKQCLCLISLLVRDDDNV